jgi:hypothetical protein
MKAIAPPGPLDAAKGALAAGHGDGEWVDGDTQQAGIPAAGVTGGRDQRAAGTQQASSSSLRGAANSQPAFLQLLEHPCVATHSLFGSSSSSPENSGVTRRECGYTRYVL